MNLTRPKQLTIDECQWTLHSSLKSDHYTTAPSNKHHEQFGQKKSKFRKNRQKSTDQYLKEMWPLCNTKMASSSSSRSFPNLNRSIRKTCAKTNWETVLHCYHFDTSPTASGLVIVLVPKSTHLEITTGRNIVSTFLSTINLLPSYW